ncbi:MAG TPA: ribosome biogenesis GTP-binding protein YsxC, partial [Candidatus Moranbacteria bacterium]|nr:ribosome biogenesis GTP-binding protein YsxC [Candidatus Moranbacteria bacterium]
MKIKSAEFVIGATGSESFPADGRPQVVFAGRSNVGKSSLLNALLERKNLVRVGSRPGKTVEINFFLVNGKFYFVDLPGYGYAKHSLKKREKLRRMILWYLSGREPIAAITVVIDARAGLKPFDRQMLELAREEKK